MSIARCSLDFRLRSVSRIPTCYTKLNCISLLMEFMYDNIKISHTKEVDSEVEEKSLSLVQNSSRASTPARNLMIVQLVESKSLT